ncbi:hypothetical protein [Spirilliplanes yamanashiensis]|uniref:hypothetical protein n=1 Tax=Spirilliplanes yamanashiensis TaxID=42233 RepID=UPI00194EEE99|nr:hypothetical protein [Spirilliplanes yamanashiensis]MDP9817486.1 hypothetical protein [Spirilliplanes yamanashiensis]
MTSVDEPDVPVGRWSVCASDANLRTPPEPGRPGNRPPGEDLDLALGWDRFEKLILAVARGTLGLRGMTFRRYGVQGQAQHGIDLAGRDTDGRWTVIQCKDYHTFTAGHLRAAVETFAAGRRPFGARHLIVATSAQTEATQLADELARLQDAHPDFELDLWGAEQINELLRSLGDVVARFWTRETARTFCTGAPPPGVPVPAPDRQAQAERILVGPLATGDVLPLLREADRRRPAEPEAAARLYGDVATRLSDDGFRGHSVLLRNRQLDALAAAGLRSAAADLAAELAVGALELGDRMTAKGLSSRTAELDGGAHAEVIGAALSYTGDPIARPNELVEALSRATVSYRPRLVLLLAEGVFATDGVAPVELDDLIGSAVAHADADVALRLRLVRAEYDSAERRTLLRSARRHQVPGRAAALISAREARRCALESRAEEAVDAWRDAVHDGIHDGLAEDAADWLYALRAVKVQFGPVTGDIDEEHRLAQAVRTTGTARLIDRARRPAEHARAAILANRPIEAVLAARRWLVDAVVTGSWADEMEALEFLGDVYCDTTELDRAAVCYQRAGRAQKLIALAGRAGDRLLPSGPLGGEPWWVLRARAALAAAQADLIGDAAAAGLLGELTGLVARGQAGEVVESPRSELTVAAEDAACALAHRGTAQQATAVLNLMAGRRRFGDRAHARACVEIAVAHPSLTVPALTRLIELAAGDVQAALKLTVDDRVLGLLPGHPELVTQAMRLADAGLYLSDVLRRELQPDHPAVKADAAAARDRILARQSPEPGHAEIGSRLVTDAYLTGVLGAGDRRSCLDRLLDIAEDTRETAANRQEALVAARNLVAAETPEDRAGVFARARAFVIGERDGSAFDGELTGPAHPLSFLRVEGGTASLRGDGLYLAVGCADTDVERQWVRDRAVELLRSPDPALVHAGAVALSELPAADTHDVDPALLAAHDSPGVREMSAILCVRRPVRYRDTAMALARDPEARVRRTLAEAAARADPVTTGEIMSVLAADVRHSVRAAVPRGHTAADPP